MNSEEDSVDFKQTFNIDFNQIEIPAQKSRKKKYIIAGIILGLVAIVTTTVLLVGHFKYNLFGSETYQVANIKRELYSVDYFTETKSTKSKLAYTSGEFQEKEQLTETDFVVMVTDKEQLPNKVILNTAALIPLKSKVKMENKEADLSAFNIFDEKTVKEFEENPDGSKYTMALIHFYENGTIKDINLPKEMDKDSAQNMVDLINNVITKLYRNKTEDDINGIQIKTKTDRKKKSLIEYEPPKEFEDKRTKTHFKGSRITKTVERDLEDDQLTEIRANTNLVLETQKEEEDYIDFGLQNFHFDSSSKISAIRTEKNKIEYADLVKRLMSKFNFVESEELIQSIIDKEIEEQDKLVEESEEDAPMNEYELRKLGWTGSFGWDWKIASTNILGQTITVTYSISLKSGKVKNTITLSLGSLTIPLGNTGGVSSDKTGGKQNGGEKQIATIPIVAGVTLGVKLGGSLGFDITFKNNIFSISLNGKVYAKAEVTIGIEYIANIKAGVTGDLISVTFTCSIKKSGSSYSKSSISLKANAGAISVYAKGTLVCFEIFNISKKLWDGWTKTITW